ncbi:M48 metallopeptidase family protein [Rhodopirellula europaea]|uniref:M48 metallopeptidase family protein n=1 Tax=Rhodopirellula europaea TaxID=1263866 RepID=UPI000587FF50|nr:M48 family metallopeptidase [Rhodopirellula europaea]
MGPSVSVAACRIRYQTKGDSRSQANDSYVVVHEMAHLIEPVHSDRFVAILDEHYPNWRDARAELNELPLGSEVWNTQSE